MSDTLNTPPTYAWVWKAFSSKLAGTVSKPTLNPTNNVYVEDVNPESEEHKIPEESLRPMDALTPTKPKNTQSGILKTPGTLQIKKTVNFTDHLGDDPLNREVQPKGFRQENEENSKKTRNRFGNDLEFEFDDKYFSQPSSKQLGYKLSQVAQLEGKERNNKKWQRNEIKNLPFKHRTGEENRIDRLLGDQDIQKFESELKDSSPLPIEKERPLPEPSDTKQENMEWSKLIKDCFRDVVNNNRKMKNIIHDVLVDTSHLVNSTEVPDEADYTINLDNPLSSSGKYWKQKFNLLETAHTDLEEELEKIRERVDAIMTERQEEISFWKRRCKLLEAENVRLSRMPKTQGVVSANPQNEYTPKVKDNHPIAKGFKIPLQENSLFRSSLPEHSKEPLKFPNETFSNPLDMSHLAAEMLSHSAKKKQSNDSFFNFEEGAGPISSTPVSAASKVRQRLLHATQTPTPMPVSIRRKEPQYKSNEIEESSIPSMGFLSKNREAAKRQIARKKEDNSAKLLYGVPSSRDKPKFTLTEIHPYDQELQPKGLPRAREFTAEQKLSKERSEKARSRLEERRQRRGLV